MNVHTHTTCAPPVSERLAAPSSLPASRRSAAFANGRRRMTMEPRISVITLGVADVASSSAFYTRVGLQRSRESDETTAFFQLGGGLVLALYGRDDLAADASLSPRPIAGNMTIGYNTRARLETDKLVAAFVGAGGCLVKEPAVTFWGGYCGYVSDPDGHVWEIAYNPHWALDENGLLTLPD